MNPDKLLFSERSLEGDILPLDYKVEYESLTMYYHSDTSREHYNYREGLLCLDRYEPVHLQISMDDWVESCIVAGSVIEESQLPSFQV